MAMIIKRFLSQMACSAGIKALPESNPFLTPIAGFVRAFGGAFAPLRSIALPSELFSAPKRLDLIHRVVGWYRAGERLGLAASKGRGQVAGSNRKIHPQKGTGKARAGDARAPHRRGGGACFGPQPRDFSFSLPLKLRWLAFRSALSEMYRLGQVTIVDAETLKLPNPKTAELAQLLADFARPDRPDRPRKLLILGMQAEDCAELVNLKLAARSLDGAQVQYLQVTGDPSQRHKVKEHQRHPVTAYHLIRSHHICLTPDAISFFKSIHDKLR